MSDWFYITKRWNKDISFKNIEQAEYFTPLLYIYNIQNKIIKASPFKYSATGNINLLFTIEEHLQKSRKANGSNGVKSQSNG